MSAESEKRFIERLYTQTRTDVPLSLDAGIEGWVCGHLWATKGGSCVLHSCEENDPHTFGHRCKCGAVKPTQETRP